VSEEKKKQKKGWNTPKPDVIPKPTAWPPALALAIMFIAWGLVSSPIVLAVGGGLFAVSLWGWIGDIRHGE
jgi:hypothetical protein